MPRGAWTALVAAPLPWVTPPTSTGVPSDNPATCPDARGSGIGGVTLPVESAFIGDDSAPSDDGAEDVDSVPEGTELMPSGEALGRRIVTGGFGHTWA